MQGYYFVKSLIMNVSLRGSIGIQKKIYNQIKVFQTIAETDLVLVDLTVPFDASILRKLPRVLPWTSIYNWEKVIPLGPCDFIYIRKDSPVTPNFISFLGECKLHGVKHIILEIPTYPYDQEFRGLVNNFYLFKDRLFRPYLKKYVDRIVTFSQDDEIFEIPTIKIVNGVDVDSEKMREYQPHGNSINLIAVASLAWWHGYDRLIKGLSDYYAAGGKENIVFHVVGEGKVLKDYQELVKKNHMEEHVVFHGAVYGEELDHLYDSMDIGICSLGAHRKKIYLTSELKSREYLAKGLPVIVSTPIDVITDEFPYWLKVPADESPIDIEAVVRFFHEKISPLVPNDLSQTIRAYAKEHCDMKITMKPVLDYLANSLSPLDRG